ncbi:hypothetical protein DICA3_D07074 [Diutina catenulata]
MKPTFIRHTQAVVQVARKPLASGNGPFVELPTFTTLGSPSNLLNITVPSSGCLNIRDGYLVGIDGDLDGIMTTETVHNGLKYHAVQPFNPISVLVAAKAANYAILNNSPVTKWTILNHQNIIAWSGHNLDLNPKHVTSKLVSFQAIGEGKVVVNGTNQRLFDVVVEDGERMLVNSNAVVATTTNLNFVGIRRPRMTWPSLPRLHLPKLPNFGYFANLKMWWDEQKSKLQTSDAARVWHEISSACGRGWRWVQLQFLDRVWRTPIYAEITGPARVLVNNQSISSGRLFSNAEKYQVLQKRN